MSEWQGHLLSCPGQLISNLLFNTTPTFLTETSHWPTTRLSKVAKRIKRNILQNKNWKFEDWKRKSGSSETFCKIEIENLKVENANQDRLKYSAKGKLKILILKKQMQTGHWQVNVEEKVYKIRFSTFLSWGRMYYHREWRLNERFVCRMLFYKPAEQICEVKKAKGFCIAWQWQENGISFGGCFKRVKLNQTKSLALDPSF